MQLLVTRRLMKFLDDFCEKPSLTIVMGKIVQSISTLLQFIRCRSFNPMILTTFIIRDNARYQSYLSFLSNHPLNRRQFFIRGVGGKDQPQ